MKEKIREFCKKHREVVSLGLSALILVILTSVLVPSEKDEIETISYTEFVELVDAGKVDTVLYSTSKEYMTVYLYNDETKDMTEEERAEYIYKPEDTRMVLYPAYDDFRKDLLEKGVVLKLDKRSGFVEIVSTLISVCLPFVFLFAILRMSMKGMTANTNTKTLLQKSNVKFSDVIGQDEILEDITFITKLIKDPTIGESVGAKTPKGVLLVGPPGTGKTLIAKAIAGEAGVPFLSIAGSDFKELFVGMGAKRVRDLFTEAKKNAPCVVFIDEIDAVGMSRDAKLTNSEDSQTINALLKEMDGFTERDGVFVIAATNRVDHLDSALVRAGRFDRQIVVNPPRDWHVRSDMFKHYLKDLKVADDVDIDSLSKQVSGFTGADIATICNEASLIAVMKEKPAVDRACIEEAIDKKIFKGNRSKGDEHKDDKRIVAYHEAGHAVMNLLNNLPIARASIMSTTSGVGGVVFGEDSDSLFMTDEELRKQIMVMYAGRASEQIKFNVVTTGAANDITQATNVMLQYIERFGFDSDFGLLDMSVLRQQSVLGSDEITDRMSEMSKSIYNKTVEVLKEHFDLVEKLAVRLLEVETMTGDEIKKLLS